MTELLRTPRAIATTAVVVLVLSLVRVVWGPTSPTPNPPTTGPPTTPGPPATVPSEQEEAAVAWARRFLDLHVDPDGRVVRTDEGGDTVSEGQAWALLVAVALEDEERAETIAGWTHDHLAGDDGLLAWQWADGEVADATPATDADLVHAWALAQGAEAFDRPDWDRRATEHLGAIAEATAVETPDGPLLTAGPWAAVEGDAVVNPSYLWPAALRWAEDRVPMLDGTLGATTALVDRLVGDDTPLVPDWLVVDAEGTPTSIGAPASPEEAPQHGLDAVRTWIWFATDCDPGVRGLAAPAHARFADDTGRPVAVHDLAGTGTVDWHHAATLAGVAAAAHAAGDEGAAAARLDEARALEDEHPSYYGAAVTALAGLLLDTDSIVDCDS